MMLLSPYTHLHELLNYWSDAQALDQVCSLLFSSLSRYLPFLKIEHEAEKIDQVFNVGPLYLIHS